MSKKKRKKGTKRNKKRNSNHYKRSNIISNNSKIKQKSFAKIIISILYKLFNPLYILISFLLLISGLAFYIPKFTIKYNYSWDFNDPFNTTFEIKNDGSFLCYEAKYRVEPRKFNINSNINVNGPLIFNKNNHVPRLCPNESTTISIEKIMDAAPRSIDYCEIYIVLDYRPVFLKNFLKLPHFILKPFIFKDTYRFAVRKIESGYIWERLYLDSENTND